MARVQIDNKCPPLEVMIMDEDKYQSWLRTGRLNTYRHFPGRKQLHVLFTAPTDSDYLVIVCNRSKNEADSTG